MDMDKILKQMQQMNAEMTANMKQANADLTANMNAKFEQITANAEMNIAELTSKIEAQRVSLTAVSYTHLDVYKRQVYNSTKYQLFGVICQLYTRIMFN